MKNENQIKMLATDLDGTLIPLADHPQHHQDLKKLSLALSEQNVCLVYVTGRHLESVTNAISEYDLPRPKTVICDVGAAIFHDADSTSFQADKDYVAILNERLGQLTLSEIRDAILAKRIGELRLQEPHKQGPFKLSFYSTPAQLADHVKRISAVLDECEVNCEIISSVDPFNQNGLIDLLPSGVSKAFALDWFCAAKEVAKESVVFAGDSGNDLHAMTAGYNTIVVGNAAPTLTQSVRSVHNDRKWHDRLYVATASATSGVLEGWERFRQMHRRM